MATVTSTFDRIEQPHDGSCLESGLTGCIVEVACAFVNWLKQSVVCPVCSDDEVATVATSSIAVDSNALTDGKTVDPTKQRVMDDSDAC